MKNKFDISQKSVVGLTLGTVAWNRFRNTKGNRENILWVKDVITYFADKTSITFAQATQAIKTDSLDHIQVIHRRLGEKLPSKVMGLDDRGQPAMVMNPLKTKFVGYGEMASIDHMAMVRTQLGMAASLRHPKDAVPKGGKTEIPPTAFKKDPFHFESSRAGHKKRLLEALSRVTGYSPQDLVTMANANPR